MKRRDILQAGSGIAAASTVGLAGCLGGGSDDGTITVGNIAPLSGPFSQIGGLMENGVDLAVKEINEADNDISIEVEHRDSEVTPDTAVSGARELVLEQNATFLTGLSSSATATAVSEFANSQQVVYAAPVAQADELTGASCNEYTFRTAGKLSMLMKALATVTNDLADVDRVAAVVPDSGATRAQWDAFQETFTELSGADVVNVTNPAFGQGDFQNEIEATINAEPDLMYSSMWGGDLIAFIQQARQTRFFDEVPEMVGAGGSTMDVSVSLGSDMVEMIGLDRYYFGAPDTERNNEFVEAYQNEFGSRPLSVAQESYAAVYGAVEAIQSEGGQSADDIIAGFEGLEWETPEGVKTMRADDHQVIEDNIWAGRIGPVDGLDFYGYSDLRPVDGAEVAGEPGDCTF